MLNLSYPKTRLRRSRLQGFTRQLLQDTQLSPQDLIYPMFISPSYNSDKVPCPNMPGQFRLPLPLALEKITALCDFHLRRGHTHCF